MKTEKNELYAAVPGDVFETPMITAYLPTNKTHNGAVVIFPGGGYYIRAEHEGKGYAEFLADNGYTAFVCDYRVFPHRFPLALLDARRAVQFARFFSEKYGIDKNKIAVMGSSAGGHLAALTSTYYESTGLEVDDEIGKEAFIPNAQILCYPVIKLIGDGCHFGSGESILGERYDALAEKLSPNRLVSEKTPPAFIWHTFDDNCVDLKNSIEYMTELHNKGIASEYHVYPHGSHGLGLACGESRDEKHISDWSRQLLNWLEYMNF